MQFIRLNLDDTLKRRFSPLIYFWGTNPQTALFGYLQGQTSLDEMPRNKFRRQYLYVSDAQYLTSNVDLSQHYTTTKSSEINNNVREDCQPDDGLSNSRKTSSTLFQLQVAADMAQQKQLVGSSLLDHNIRLALQDMLLHNKDIDRDSDRKSGRMAESVHVDKSHEEPICNGAGGAEDERLKRLKEVDLSSSGSSSDSGVFPGHSSSASSSTASLSDVTELDKCCDKCTCKTRYNGTLSSHLDGPPKPILSADRDAQQLGSPDASSTREHLQYGQCALDWHIDSHRHYHKNKLVALISAGMTTGSDKKYVTDTVKTLEGLGYEVCVFIRRGVGGLKLSSVKFFSPAKWRDFEAAVMSVRQQRPGARLVAVGFSFGSIELCRYLSMSGKQSLVDAALLISCPFDPEAGGRNMRKRALNRRIDAYLARQLGKQLYQAMFASSATSGTLTATVPASQDRKSSVCVNMNGSSVNLASLPKIKSLVDFEDNYNRILQNYPNSDAYAADSRLQDRLASIETPTLCLSSEDDFMAPLKLLPLEQIRANKNLCMLLTKRGGHMAFIDGILWPKKPYFAQRIIGNYMKAVRASFSTSDNHHVQDRAKAAAKQIEIAKQSHLIQMFDVK